MGLGELVAREAVDAGELELRGLGLLVALDDAAIVRVTQDSWLTMLLTETSIPRKSSKSR